MRENICQQVKECPVSGDSHIRTSLQCIADSVVHHEAVLCSHLGLIEKTKADDATRVMLKIFGPTLEKLQGIIAEKVSLLSFHEEICKLHDELAKEIYGT